MTDGIWTIVWSFVIVIALYPIEFLFPAETGQPLSKRFHNLIYMPFIIGFMYFLQPFVNAIAGMILQNGSVLSAVLSPTGKRDCNCAVRVAVRIVVGRLAVLDAPTPAY